jgi:hypothetical protein
MAESAGGYLMRADPKLTQLLEDAFDWLNRDEKKQLGAEEYARRRFDFAFHMTDWLSDLQKLSQIYKNPSGTTPKEAGHEMIGFLVHVIPHLRAAGRAYLGEEVSDPFKKADQRNARKASQTARKAKSKSKRRAG